MVTCYNDKGGKCQLENSLFYTKLLRKACASFVKTVVSYLIQTMQYDDFKVKDIAGEENFEIKFEF